MLSKAGRSSLDQVCGHHRGSGGPSSLADVDHQRGVGVIIIVVVVVIGRGMSGLIIPQARKESLQ